MPQMSSWPFRRVYFSPQLLRSLTRPIRAAAQEVARDGHGLDTESVRSLVVVKASEVIQRPDDCVPGWTDAETSYLVVADVPEPALFRLPTILRVHKPDQRMHVSRDVDVVKRQVIALTRDRAFEGIVDAYVLWRDLWVVLGDMTIRSFPVPQVTFLSALSDEDLQKLEVQSSGSYLHWPTQDLRVGASQLLQAVDPMFLADVAIERYAVEKMSLALRLLREERGLTQSQIHGISDRHVRRLENEEVRLTSDAAHRYSEAFGLRMDEFLADLARTIGRLRDRPEEMQREEELQKGEERYVS